jgi:hypothetical protein
MQNYCKTIGALAAASALVAGNAQAEVEYEIHTGYSSEYLFRGVDLGDHLTEVGVDASSDLGNGLTISGGVWAAAFDSPVATGNQIDNEIDWYAEIGKDLGFANVSVGYIYYWNVGALGEDQQEVPFTISRDFGAFEAYLTYFWKVDGPSNEGYSELGVAKSWELSPCLNLNASSNLGYLVQGGDFTAWTTKVALDWGFAENAKVSPFVALSIGLGESNEGGIWGSTENELVGGSMLSVSF